jgi:hypothetical protein
LHDRGAQEVAQFEAVATQLGLDLVVVRLEDKALSDLYEAPLVLIRPDHMVAWRGRLSEEAPAVLAQVTGQVWSG